MFFLVSSPFQIRELDFRGEDIRLRALLDELAKKNFWSLGATAPVALAHHKRADGVKNLQLQLVRRHIDVDSLPAFLRRAEHMTEQLKQGANFLRSSLGFLNQLLQWAVR